MSSMHSYSVSLTCTGSVSNVASTIVRRQCTNHHSPQGSSSLAFIEHRSSNAEVNHIRGGHIDSHTQRQLKVDYVYAHFPISTRDMCESH